jgi:CO/xanthine dehydrogenase FAD-binding subunit
MGDMAVSRDDQRRVLSHDGRRQHVGMPRKSADYKPVTIDPDPIEPGDTIDVDERAIRNRGTIGGNLAHADPASELPAVMLALDAEMVLRSRNSERRVPAESFFLGTFETAARADELLTAICIPLASGNRHWGFDEMSQRQGDYALVAVAATFDLDGGRCARPRLAYAGVADRAVRILAAEAALEGAGPHEATFEAVAAKAAEAVKPPEDIHADAAYRRDLVRALTRRALTAATRRGPEERT